MSGTQVLSAAFAMYASYLIFRHVLFVLYGFFKIGGSPSRLVLFSTASPLRAYLPSLRTAVKGDSNPGFTPYKKAHSSILSSVPILDPSDRLPTFWIAEPESVKIILADRFTFQKDVELNKGVRLFGQNVVTADGSDWRRHRDVAKRAFVGNTDLVWSVSSEVLRTWFIDIDHQLKGREDLEIDVLNSMSQINVLAISAASFGRQTSWSEDETDEPPEGYELTFHEALTTAVETLFVKLLAPVWAYPLCALFNVPYFSILLHKTDLSYNQLTKHLTQMIKSAREPADLNSPPSADLLTQLTQANRPMALTDAEIASNVYAFLLSGNETSAQALSFTLALLAIHPEVQERLYEETLRIFPKCDWPKEDVQSFREDYAQLEFTLAVLRESMRLFPVVPRITKICTTDTFLPARVRGKKEQVFVFEGGRVVIDIAAIHRHPDYWGATANEFRPERFIDKEGQRWPREAYLPFGAGPRQCIGEVFALTEMVCSLAHVVRRYKLLPPEDLANASYGQKCAKLLRFQIGLTASPLDVRLRLVPRYQ